ncbi:MAG: hypothetical protein ACXVAX_04400, partial [Pseudobdellovibrio sp.]
PVLILNSHLFNLNDRPLVANQLILYSKNIQKQRGNRLSENEGLHFVFQKIERDFNEIKTVY